jgi:hypothetical protein
LDSSLDNGIHEDGAAHPPEDDDADRAWTNNGDGGGVDRGGGGPQQYRGKVASPNSKINEGRKRPGDTIFFVFGVLLVRCAFFDRNLHSTGAIEFLACAPLEALAGM